ncbi:MAG TPA: RHS repeat-associated core domain-containing protein, partial [Terrimicrobiaceae bacterium]
ETLHILDDKQCIALVETKTIDTQSPVLSPQSLLRYQLGNHLSSASVELDDAGQIISYEEYYSYGSTSYQAGRSAAEVSLKRYRYTGKERDEESGFSYHGARYYASWLGKWISCDPSGLTDGLNVYRFTRNNPIVFVDSNGRDSEITWENSLWTYADDEGNIWNYIVTYGWQKKTELVSEWEEEGGYELDLWSFWLVKKGEPTKKSGLKAVSTEEWTVLDERWIQATTEVIRVEGSAPKEEEEGVVSKIWNGTKSAAGLAFDLWSPTGKAKYVKWGIQLFQSYRESGSAVQAVKDVTVKGVKDKLFNIATDKLSQLAAQLGGKIKMPKKTHLALGRNEALEKFAESQGAVSIFGAYEKQYFVAAADPSVFKGQFAGIADLFTKNGGRIKFNLTGMDAKLKDTVTSWELQQILKSDALKSKTDFFENGKKLTGKKLRERLDQWR